MSNLKNDLVDLLETACQAPISRRHYIIFSNAELNNTMFNCSCQNLFNLNKIQWDTILFAVGYLKEDTKGNQILIHKQPFFNSVFEKKYVTERSFFGVTGKHKLVTIGSDTIDYKSINYQRKQKLGLPPKIDQNTCISKCRMTAKVLYLKSCIYLANLSYSQTQIITEGKLKFARK